MASDPEAELRFMANQPTPETATSGDARFAAEALCWLPEITRLARVLTRNTADGDDLAQETFLRAYRFWNTYMPGTDCRRWLVTICHNLHRSRVVRESLVESVGDDLDVEIFATVRSHHQARDRGADDLFERFDLGSAIQDAIDDLSEPYRTTVQLVDVEDMTYEDVAAALDVPIGTVRSRLFRGRRILQETLINHALDAGLTPSPPVRRTIGGDVTPRPTAS
jgi:RNA polymerase sigma-70 factor (ECF subfamily)